MEDLIGLVVMFVAGVLAGYSINAPREKPHDD